MVRRWPRMDAFVVALLWLSPAPAAAQCLLCPALPQPAKPDERAPVPLSIEVDAGLDFPRLVSGGSHGSVTLTPGAPPRTSGALQAVGGMAMHGRVLVRGEPGRALRIDLPERVVLRTPAGETAELHSLTSGLPPAPRLGPDGLLRFEFGGRLDVGANGAGDYRGRIPITVDYL